MKTLAFLVSTSIALALTASSSYAASQLTPSRVVIQKILQSFSPGTRLQGTMSYGGEQCTMTANNTPTGLELYILDGYNVLAYSKIMANTNVLTRVSGGNGATQYVIQSSINNGAIRYFTSLTTYEDSATFDLGLKAPNGALVSCRFSE